MLRMFVLATLVATTGAAAQTANAPGGEAHNGTIGPAAIPGATREEKLRNITLALRKMDTNGDERITREEWVAAGGKPASFDMLDHNKDNVLTWQELRSNAKMLKAFADFEAAPLH